MEDIFAHADYASLVDQVDLLVVEVVLPVPAAPVLAAAVDGEDIVLAAALKVVVPQDQRHCSVIAFRAD